MSAGAALNLATLTEDDRAEMRAMQAEERLIDFIRLCGRAVEPQTEYLHGWPLEALCEHLEAVAAGEITRLIINVPPGFMKSSGDVCIFAGVDMGSAWSAASSVSVCVVYVVADGAG